MPAPLNSFKAALANGRAQIGLWVALGSANATELVAGAGFDWLLIDGEHAPYDVATITAQLRAASGSHSAAVVRPPAGETWMIKQLLDIGAQTLLVPMVEDAAQARDLVRATRYSPQGIRGVGASLGRASGFNRIPDYLQTANDQICLLVQVETVNALSNIEEIAATEGVDGIFIGPVDLAADMGLLGNPGHPDVQNAIEQGIKQIVAAGRSAGILTSDPVLAKHYLALGATFVAVGTDATLLSKVTSDLAASFKHMSVTAPNSRASAGY